jgi:hypothetical protein
MTSPAVYRQLYRRVYFADPGGLLFLNISTPLTQRTPTQMDYLKLCLLLVPDSGEGRAVSGFINACFHSSGTKKTPIKASFRMGCNHAVLKAFARPTARRAKESGARAAVHNGTHPFPPAKDRC